MALKVVVSQLHVLNSKKEEKTTLIIENVEYLQTLSFMGKELHVSA